METEVYEKARSLFINLIRNETMPETGLPHKGNSTSKRKCTEDLPKKE